MAGLLDLQQRGLLDMAQNGDGSLLSSYTPSLRDKVKYWLAENWYGDTREGVEKAGRLSDLFETVTPYGLATMAYDGGRAGGSGDYLGAGVMGAMSALPLPASVEKEAKKFLYAPKYRAPSHATMPKGFIDFGPPTAEHKFGTVSYPTPLNSKDLNDFELVPLDPNHPMNIRVDFEAFQNRFTDQFSNSGERYISPQKDMAVTPNLSGDGWQVTLFNNEGTPTGHEVITDYDELSRLVWAHQKQTNKNNSR